MFVENMFEEDISAETEHHSSFIAWATQMRHVYGMRINRNSFSRDPNVRHVCENE
jgi:hypothetical protein